MFNRLDVGGHGKNVPPMKKMESDFKKRFGLEYNPLDDINRIKRFPIRFADEAYGDKIGYVIFIRPEMNLFVDTKSYLNDDSKNDPFIEELFKDRYIGRSILYSLGNSNQYNSPFLSIIGSRAKSFTPVESTIRVGETGENFIGQKVAYGNDNSAENSAGQFTLPLTLGRYQIAYKTIKVWKEYIERLSRGEARRTKYNITHNIIDYGGAAFFIMTRADGEILNWWRYQGVFPIDLSAESFNHTVGQPSGNDMNVTFKYSIVSKSMDMVALGELKQISDAYARSIGSNSVRPYYDANMGAHGEVYVDAPYIIRRDGKIYLEWR